MRTDRISFNIIHPVPQDLLLFERLKHANHLKFAVAGFEIGEVTYLPHLQCYIELEKPVNFYRFRNFYFNKRTYAQPSRGTEDSNFRYCVKQARGHLAYFKGRQLINTLPPLDKESINQYIKSFKGLAQPERPSPTTWWDGRESVLRSEAE